MPRPIRPTNPPILALQSPAATGQRIDFNRQIRPILSKNCYTCHGPDVGERKAKLRRARLRQSRGERRTYR